MSTKSDFAKNSTYNMWGTFFYFFCQWITTILVARMAGFSSAGVYSMAVSFTNLFGFVSRFGVRNFQIADVQKKYADGSYRLARVYTSLLAVALFFISLPFVKFTPETMACCLVMIAFKIMESVTDLQFGTLQRQEDYRTIAISYTLKGIIPIIVFVFLLALELDLVYVLLGMTIAYFFTILLYDSPRAGRRLKTDNRSNKADALEIIRASVPLMLATLVTPYNTFITRYAIEKSFSDAQLGYYSSVAMLVVVTNTLAGSVWIVLVPQLSAGYENKTYKKLAKTLFLSTVAMFGVCLILFVAAYFWGDFGLNLVFGAEILPYRFLLFPTILVSVLLALVALFNMALIAFQKRRLMLIGSLIGVAICSFSAFPFVQRWGMLGACYCQMFGFTVQLIVLGIFIFFTLRNGQRDTYDKVAPE